MEELFFLLKFSFFSPVRDAAAHLLLHRPTMKEVSLLLPDDWRIGFYTVYCGFTAPA